MYSDAWTPMTGKAVRAFLHSLDPIDGTYAISRKTTIAWRHLPFYDEVVLLRLRDAAWPRNLHIYYLARPGDTPYRLDGQSSPMQSVNAAAPIQLTRSNVLAYLKFFCFFLRAEDGPFLIAEQLSDPYMPPAPDARTRARLACVVRSAMYEGQNARGEFVCDGVVYYGNALFVARFAVDPGGMVTMLDDEPMATDLPMRVHAPIA